MLWPKFAYHYCTITFDALTNTSESVSDEPVISISVLFAIFYFALERKILQFIISFSSSISILIQASEHTVEVDSEHHIASKFVISYLKSTLHSV